MQAARLERKLASHFPDVHAESSDALSKIRAIGEEADRFRRDFDGEDGWTCIRRAEDLSFWLRQADEDSPHRARMREDPTRA